TITNSYSEGTINSDAISGGLVGMLYNREYSGRKINITITDSYSTATLKTDKASGGLVGANDGYNDYPGNYTVLITNSHFAGKAQYPILNSTIDRSTVKTPMTVNLTNVYYVEGTYTAPGVEFTSVSKVEAVSAGQLADGTVLDLLNDGRDVWKQGATHPILEVETTPLKTLMVNDASVDTAQYPFAYDAGSVEADVDEIEIEATPVQSNAKVLISAVDDAGKVEVPESGGNTVVVPLAEGRTTTITIAVTHNFQTTNYTVSVYRKPRPWTGGYEMFANYDDSIAASAEKVYEIANADQLAFFAKIINEGTITAEDKDNWVATVTLDENTYQIPQYGMYNLFSNGTVVKLTADIDLGNMPFKAIGYNNSVVKQFGGTFDGDGHEIKNLTINEKHEGVGLFTKVGYGGAVKNLTVRGSVTNTGRYTGGIAGQLYESATLENCAFIGDVVSGAHNVGGLAGGTSPSGTYSLTNCYSSGTVTAKGNLDVYTAVGGLLGDARKETWLTNCYSTMTIQAAENPVAAMTLGDGVGGLIGKLNNTFASGAITYDNCYFAGDVCSSYPISPMTDGDVVTINNKLLYEVDSFDGEVEGVGSDTKNAYTAAEFADGTVATVLGEGWATAKTGHPVRSEFIAAANALGIEGTSIRTSAPNGLRFHFKVNETAQTANLKEFGVIVAKANSADDYGLYLGSAKSAYLPAFVKGTDPKFVRQNIKDTDGTYDWFTARVDFEENSTNHTTDYSARAYAVYEDDKGQEVVIYSVLIDHESYYTSLHSIAAIALEESAQTDYEDSEKAHLQTIVDAVEG
ncbi:MAG: cadherin-like beta sandwich domain-containing protein, partial [Clostridia bacterium]|nr:cadherin-like beta sandwich domain-containing protein [Clostridia bacterium]